MGWWESFVSAPEFRIKYAKVGAASIDAAVLSNEPSASIDYLVAPHLSSQGRSWARVDPFALAKDGPISAAAVVLVRYLPKHWIKPLQKYREDGGRVVYFMDDDLMDRDAAVGLPAAYAKKLSSLATSRRKDIEALCDEFWVASEFLQKKYSHWNPVLLSPFPVPSCPGESDPVTVFYHGTASHRDELEWLVEIVRAVLERSPDSRFEIFGDHSINKLYRNLPRTAVLHPMSWTNYLSYTSSRRAGIGLAPLLPGAFNAARGPTKFFDMTRMGAVGVCSDVRPYKRFIRDGVDGMLLPNEQEAWVETITELIVDRDRRNCMADEASRRAAEMRT